MTYKLSTRHTHFVTTPHGEVQVDFQPSFDDHVLHERVGDKLVVAYLVHDDDHRDIDDLMGDGMGKLLSFHRHSKDHAEAFEALGRDRDGGPNLDKVFEDHADEVLRRYIEKVLHDHEAEDVVCNLGHMHDANGDVEAYAEKLLADEFNIVSRRGHVWFDAELETILVEMWEDPAYFPGDPDAVVLDCYSHGADRWSVSGGGMQCRWDTARGAGVWVPDDVLRDMLTSVNPWAFVRTHPLTLRGPGNKCQLVEVKWNEAGVALVSLELSDDYAALDKLATAIRDGRPAATPAHQRWARANQAEIYARQFLDQYNDIINGNIYGCVVQSYELQVDSDDAWVETGDRDDCWGFVGDDYAMETLRSEYLEPAVSELSKEVTA